MNRNLLDNDIVLKISQYFLIDEFFDTCASPESIFILPTLKYRFHLKDENKALKIVKNNEALKALNEFVNVVSEVSEEVPIDILNLFSSIDQIDQGEAILFALTAMNDQSITITGDKRALKALVKIGDEKDFLDDLRGSLKCFEQVVAEMLLSQHETNVIKKISGRHWDTALRACFSTGNKQAAIEGLHSYYNNINKQCLNLLAPFPAY